MVQRIVGEKKQPQKGPCLFLMRFHERALIQHACSSRTGESGLIKYAATFILQQETQVWNYQIENPHEIKQLDYTFSICLMFRENNRVVPSVDGCEQLCWHADTTTSVWPSHPHSQNGYFSKTQCALLPRWKRSAWLQMRGLESELNVNKGVRANLHQSVWTGTEWVLHL